MKHNESKVPEGYMDDSIPSRGTCRDFLEEDKRQNHKRTEPSNAHREGRTLHYEGVHFAKKETHLEG